MEISPPLTESPAPVPVPPTSLMARMLNVFATPGEVFDEVKNARPSTANWLVPTLLAIAAGMIAMLVIYSQPAVLQQIHELQTKGIEDRVNAGKMTRAQADQAETMIEKFGGVTALKIFGAAGVTVWIFARVFWWALVLWLLGKWGLKAEFTYQQALEVAGLTSIILVLGNIVFALLTVFLGRIAPVNLALFANPADTRSPLHFGLSAVELFDLWSTAVMSVGLARLAGVPWTRALALTMAYWLVIAALFAGCGWFFANLGSGFK